MATSSPSSDRHVHTAFIARVAIGLVLGCFGFWELTDPGQWTGYVPHAVAAAMSPASVVLLHGWILFVLAAATLVDVGAPVTSWVAVAVMAEVVLGLILTSGLTDILVRDIGLLALTLVWALDNGAGRAAGGSPAAPGPSRTRGRTAAY